MKCTCPIFLYSRDYTCQLTPPPAQVFRQDGGQRLYLRVIAAGWWICSTLEGEGCSLKSYSTSLCPGHPAAGQDGEGETLGWMCADSMELDKTVTVTCSVHWPGGEGEGEGR